MDTDILPRPVVEKGEPGIEFVGAAHRIGKRSCKLLGSGLGFDADLVVGLARLEAADTLHEAIESLARRETLALLASRAGIERVLEKAMPMQASAA